MPSRNLFGTRGIGPVEIGFDAEVPDPPDPKDEDDKKSTKKENGYPGILDRVEELTSRSGSCFG